MYVSKKIWFSMEELKKTRRIKYFKGETQNGGC